MKKFDEVESGLILISKGHNPDFIDNERSTMYLLSEYYVYQHKHVSIQLACEKVLELLNSLKLRDTYIQNRLSDILLVEMNPYSFRNNFLEKGKDRLFTSSHHYYQHLLERLYSILRELKVRDLDSNTGEYYDCYSFELESEELRVLLLKKHKEFEKEGELK